MILSSVGVATDSSNQTAKPNPYRGGGLRQSAWKGSDTYHVAAAKPKARVSL